jgi:hypothetical protein
VSRYDLFRRRIAPVAFGIAIVLMARESCTKEQRTRATIVFDIGAGNHVAGLDAELMADGALIGTFHHAAFTDRVHFDASLPAADGEMWIEVDLGDHARRTTRHFHVEDGSTLTIPLAAELSAK